MSLVPTHSIPRRRKVYGSQAVQTHRYHAYGPEGPMTLVDLPPVRRDVAPSDDAGDFVELEPMPVATPVRSSNGSKKQRQWEKWALVIIPALVEPFLSLLRLTDSLRNDIPSSLAVNCTCPASVRRLEVKAIYFDKISNVSVCSCSAARQLLLRRLFPCAPSVPSLAFDITMLEYVKELFVRVPPNATGWCEAVESVLRERNYTLTGQGSIRRRFATAFYWYRKLVNAKDNFVKEKLQAARFQMIGMVTDDDTSGPSEYLRERCPLCFGSNYTCSDVLADVIVCVDACFTQKRRRNPRGGGRGTKDFHSNTVFLSEEEVAEAEKLVEDLRSGAPPPPPTTSNSDGYEHAMKVPTSVLDGCNDSFTAADSKRVKASTQFFADTGLMALLCRHDRVLWLVNMTSPGEKQHYVIALLLKLFDHLPPDITVGVLYDIACQLHRSCVKWDFLGAEILSRIIWAVSVFHAFGHQWPCQLVYHPRKCVGFGLSDGEGCERFWSSIKILIPSLRVSGYFNRLYTLDAEVEFLSQKSMQNLGVWLARKWKHCHRRKQEALKTLSSVEISKAELRTQWSAQVAEQTKPLAKQSRSAANKAIEEVMSLIENRKSIQKDLLTINTLLSSDSLTILEAEDLRNDKENHTEKLMKVQESIKAKRDRLGVDGRASLAKLVDNQFLQLRMKSMALKDRIRARLRERKFELERLERAYRQTSSSERKLQSHIFGSVKRHEPGITSLVTRYNKLCDEMQTLKSNGKGPRSAMVPLKINRGDLFKLDVDDNIWQDLVEIKDNDAPPAWLSDEKTRLGIKAVLEYDRCLEEEERLKKERCAMQQWLLEEWAATCIILEGNIDENTTYQLERYKWHLCHLYTVWKKQVKDIPCLYKMPESWGPEEKDVVDILGVDGNIGDIARQEEDLSSDEDSDLSGEDEELMEAMESIPLERETIEELNDSMEGMFIRGRGRRSSKSKSPQKRQQATPATPATVLSMGGRQQHREESPTKRQRI